MGAVSGCLGRLLYAVWQGLFGLRGRGFYLSQSSRVIVRGYFLVPAGILFSKAEIRTEPVLRRKW